jgi:hypothetical protein
MDTPAQSSEAHPAAPIAGKREREARHREQERQQQGEVESLDQTVPFRRAREELLLDGLAGLALTSSRFPNGSVSAEVARRQNDGRWLWVIDQFSI